MSAATGPKGPSEALYLYEGGSYSVDVQTGTGTTFNNRPSSLFYFLCLSLICDVIILFSATALRSERGTIAYCQASRSKRSSGLQP